jgi:hypothetical protein
VVEKKNPKTDRADRVGSWFYKAGKDVVSSDVSKKKKKKVTHLNFMTNSNDHMLYIHKPQNQTML